MESPWRANAETRGIRVDRVVLNARQAFCNSFTLVYDRPFRVYPSTSSPSSCRVTSDGTGECTLYQSVGNRQVARGRFHVPVDFTVTLGR